MGKGNRNRVIKAEERQATREKAAKKQAKQKKAIKWSAIIAGVLCLTVVASLLISAGINSHINSGDGLRKAIVAKSEHHQVTGTMASYYMYSIYETFKSNNAAYLDMLVDLNTSLKKQPCYYDTSKQKTWFQYFVEVTSQEIAIYLSYAELASKDGMTLSDESIKLIDNSIKSLKDTATRSNMSFDLYLRNKYGRGVKEQDIRSALELYYLAMQKKDEMFESKVLTDEDLNKYVSENMSSFYTASYYEITIDAEYDVGAADQETINNAILVAKAKAEAMARIKDAKAFENAMKDYHTNELELTTDQAAKAVANCTFTDVSYKDSSDLQKWLFSTDRVAGEAKVFEGTEKYTVVYIIEPSHKDTTESRNFKHILLSLDNFATTAEAKAKADEIVATLKNDLTDEKFDAMAKQFSEDTQIDYKNMLSSNLGDKVGTWLFAAERNIGDIAVIENGSLVHIVYYTQNGLEVWEQQASNALKNDYCSKEISELNKQISALIDRAAFEGITI